MPPTFLENGICSLRIFAASKILSGAPPPPIILPSYSSAIINIFKQTYAGSTQISDVSAIFGFGIGARFLYTWALISTSFCKKCTGLKLILASFAAQGTLRLSQPARYPILLYAQFALLNNKGNLYFVLFQK